MKRIVRHGFVALAAFVCFNVTTVKAQDEEIEYEDLYNYALTMQVVEQMKASVQPALLNLIEMQEGFDVKRYSELKSGGNDAEKLKALGANEFEVKFMIKIDEEMTKRKEAIVEAINLLAKNMIGTAKYKQIKSAIKSDDDVKAEYKDIQNKIEPLDLDL